MIEFGSDYHFCDYPKADNMSYLGGRNLYASGRQALKHLIMAHNWSSLWVPTYFCGETLDHLNNLIDLKYYNIVPGDKLESCIPTLEIKNTDALLLVNYFGMYSWHDASHYKCTVIEDHTHDLTGNWVKNSNADWCVASLRKTLPIADGGVLWSPKSRLLPKHPLQNNSFENAMTIRYKAMQQKCDYLLGNPIEKELFLSAYRNTEEMFSQFELSDCSITTRNILSDIDIEKWHQLKRLNFKILVSKLCFRNTRPLIKYKTGITPFSMVILFENMEQRNNAREYLINKKVYPAILWPDVDNNDPDAIDFSNRMLSIHCDARYSESDILQLAEILNPIL